MHRGGVDADGSEDDVRRSLGEKGDDVGIGSGGGRRVNGPVHPLITRDPVSGGELVVTRLECPESGVVIEGAFSLGWLARLTPEQLEFARLLLVNRGNVQKAAAELGVAYNTARNRLDDIVTALGGPSDAEAKADARAARQAALDRLAAGEIDVEEAMRLIRST